MHDPTRGGPIGVIESIVWMLSRTGAKAGRYSIFDVMQPFQHQWNERFWFVFACLAASALCT